MGWAHLDPRALVLKDERPWAHGPLGPRALPHEPMGPEPIGPLCGHPLGTLYGGAVIPFTVGVYVCPAE